MSWPKEWQAQKGAFAWTQLAILWAVLKNAFHVLQNVSQSDWKHPQQERNMPQTKQGIVCFSQKNVVLLFVQKESMFCGSLFMTCIWDFQLAAVIRGKGGIVVEKVEHFLHLLIGEFFNSFCFALFVFLFAELD